MHVVNAQFIVSTFRDRALVSPLPGTVPGGLLKRSVPYGREGPGTERR